MKKPFINDKKVKSLLYIYKLREEDKSNLNNQQQNKVFVSLYYLMEPWTYVNRMDIKSLTIYATASAASYTCCGVI